MGAGMLARPPAPIHPLAHNLKRNLSAAGLLLYLDLKFTFERAGELCLLHQLILFLRNENHTR